MDEPGSAPGGDPVDGGATPPSSNPSPPPGFAPPPAFEAAPSFGGSPSYGGTPPFPPPAPPTEPQAEAPTHSNWRALIAPTEPVDSPRPAPTLASMVAVGGGLLAAGGLFSLLGELDGYDQRVVGLAISLLFVALGVAISVLNRSSRAAAGGVALSILAVIPFTLYIFANADLFDLFSDEGPTGDPWSGVRWTVTLMLGTAAVLWLAGYLFVPTRRYGAYLGAALVAIWLIPLFNLQLSAIEDAVGSFGPVTTFNTIPSDPGFDSGFGDPTFDDPSFEDDFGQFDEDFGQFDEDFGQFDEDVSAFEEPDDPSTRMGVVSLVFGAAYLGFAGWRDRKGDARMATAALVPAIIALYAGSSLLAAHIGWFGRGLLGLLVGGAVLAVGLRGKRRASSWIGLFLATVALGSLVVEPFDESPRAVGAVLTVLGVAIALAVGRTASGPRDPAAGPAPEPPAPPAPPAPEPYGTPEPSPWSASF
ncbi:MAG TPA: hypothetical protein VNS19_20840 [Acidimicrobiales bacterium]|nr:hypothetical protein [Acidimicrobiales bacterium]